MTDSPLVLHTDDDTYWDHYVSSVTTPGAGPPVRTDHPELAASVLAAVGLPTAVAASTRSTDGGGLGAGLALLHRDRDLGRVPCLERRLREVAAVTAPRPDEWVVGVGGGVALGLARAVADGRPFLAVRDLADPRLARVAERAASLYVVTDRADPAVMSDLQREADARATHEVLPGVRGCPVGFLHGRDFAAMTQLDARQRRPLPPDAAPDVVVDSTVHDAPVVAGPDLATAPYRQVGRETIERHERIRLLTITSHGMSDQVHLNSDYLCGRSPYLDVADLTGAKLPSCTMTEGAHCYFKPSGHALPVHRIPAEHVFVNSCGSLSFDEPDFHPLFALWYSAMDGRARSFVGTIRWKDGHGLEGLLYRHLLRTGLGLGEAVHVLNRALPGNQLEGGDVYFLLGDPTDRLAGPVSSLSARPVPGLAVAELVRGRNVVRLAGGLARSVVTAPDLVDAVRETGLHVRHDGDGDLHTSTIPTDDGSAAHVLLFTGSDEDRDATVDVGDFRAEHATMLAVSDALAETLNPVLGMHGLYPDPVRQGGRKNLEGRLLQLSRLYKARYTEPAAAARLVRSGRTLLRELDSADDQIARWLQDRIRTSSYRFSEHYQDNFLLAGAAPGPPCYQCGRTVVRRELRHILRPSVRRTELICTRCGSIADTPDPGVELLVDLPETVRRGEKASVHVRLDNRSETPRTGYCLAAVRKSAGAGIEQFDTVHPVTVAPGGRAEATFDLVLATTTPVHQYDLQAAFVSMTRIHLGRRAFWITE